MDAFQKRIASWAAERNLLNNSSPECQLTKLCEEVGELCTAVARGIPHDEADAIGDIQVVLAVICAMRGCDIDSCREDAWQEIKDRTGRIVDGAFVKD